MSNQSKSYKLFEKCLMYYMGAGFLYNTGRCFYYFDKIEDSSYTYDNDGKMSKIIHPITTINKMQTTIFHQFSLMIWPIFPLMDLNDYQKSKYGVKSIRPPFPFGNYQWKKENTKQN